MSLDSFYAGGPRTWEEAFPPVCLRTHWDPTAVTKHILPNLPQRTTLPLDPRQATKICYGYYHTGFGDTKSDSYEDDSSTVAIPAALRGAVWASHNTQPSDVLPPGGAAGRGFPYSHYAQQIDSESDLQLLNLPNTRCADKKYIPTHGKPPQSIADNNIPGANPDILSPFATVVAKSTHCRAQDDAAAWNRSSRLFFNPTKYDRTQGVPKGTHLPDSLTSLRCPT